MKQFRAAIVGCGHVSPMHGLSLGQTPNARLVAVCDKIIEKARQKAEDFGAGAYYADLDEMLEAEKPDTLHICAPHYLHPPMAIKAMEKGIHVLTEKPMATNVADAERMIAVSEKTGSRLAVISQNRYNAGAALIRKAIDDGLLGRLMGQRAYLAWIRDEQYYKSSDWKGTWDKEGGGVIIDQAIHTLDMLRYLADSEVRSVEATFANRYHPYIEVEDTAEGVIEFANGTKATFHTMNFYSFNSPVEIELQFENAVARMTLDEGEIRFNDGRILAARRNPAERLDFAGKNYWGINHVKQIQQFYAALETGAAFVVDGPEALKTQKIVNAIYDSGRTGKKIVF